MATDFRVQVSLNRDGGLGEDVATNVMHFQGDQEIIATETERRASWDLQLPGLVTRVKQLYTSLGTYLSGANSGTGTIKVYDMADPRPRVPRLTDVLTFTPGTGVLPSEVAICVSFRATPQAGQVAARRRGRVYVGPISNVASDWSPGVADPKISSAARTAIVNAFVAAARGGDGAPRLAVFSPTVAAGAGGGNETADAAWTDVTQIYVDDAFDTIRSRGAKSSVRTLATLTG